MLHQQDYFSPAAYALNLDDEQEVAEPLADFQSHFFRRTMNMNELQIQQNERLDCLKNNINKTPSTVDFEKRDRCLSCLINNIEKNRQNSDPFAIIKLAKNIESDVFMEFRTSYGYLRKISQLVGQIQKMTNENRVFEFKSGLEVLGEKVASMNLKNSCKNRINKKKSKKIVRRNKSG